MLLSGAARGTPYFRKAEYSVRGALEARPGPVRDGSFGRAPAAGKGGGTEGSMGVGLAIGTDAVRACEVSLWWRGLRLRWCGLVRRR